MKRVVIVGGGMAGLYAAISLREGGYSDALTLISAEKHLPYDRPPLSKEVLLGKAEDSFLHADWPQLDLDLRLGVEAYEISGSTLKTSDGSVDFDRLIIACGSSPIWLPASEELSSTHVVRTLDDSLRLRAALQPGAAVVVIGAGWIGAEVAAAAATLGCSVTVVEAMGHPLAAAMPAVIGNATLPWYAEAGVRLLLDARVTSIAEGAVELASGETLSADAIVVGVGVRPATAWVGSAVERDSRGAVVVDSRCRTSRPDIYAIGDCTIFTSARYGGPMHIEHWDNARKQPMVAAANILGGDEIYDPVPYFWSNQFGRMVQYVGHHSASDELIWRGSPSDPKWSAFWVNGSKPTAAVGVSKPRDVIQGRMLMEQDGSVDVAVLADASVGVSQAAL